VDLAKAYDMMSWNEFIRMTLIEAGFPMELNNVIMSSVKTVRTNVRWNGARAEFFLQRKV